jgi:hypothetical protein
MDRFNPPQGQRIPSIWEQPAPEQRQRALPAPPPLTQSMRSPVPQQRLTELPPPPPPNTSWLSAPAPRSATPFSSDVPASWTASPPQPRRRSNAPRWRPASSSSSPSTSSPTLPPTYSSPTLQSRRVSFSERQIPQRPPPPPRAPTYLERTRSLPQSQGSVNAVASAMRGLIRRAPSLPLIRANKYFDKFYDNIRKRTTRVTSIIDYIVMLGDGAVVNRQPNYKLTYKNTNIEFYISLASSNNWFYVYIPDQPKKKGIYNAVYDKLRDGIIGTHYTLGFSSECNNLFMLHKTEYTIKELGENKNTLQKSDIMCNMEISDIQQNLQDLSSVECKLCSQQRSIRNNLTLRNTYNDPDFEYIKYIIQLGFTDLPPVPQTQSAVPPPPPPPPQNTPPPQNKRQQEPITVSGAILHEGLYGGTYKIKNNKKVYIKKKHKCSKETLKNIYHFIYNKKPKTVKTVEVIIHNDGHIVILYHYSNNKVTFKTTTCKTIQEEMKH